MTNYASFALRITESQTMESLKKLEISLDRLWNAGIFTITEFKRLDCKIVDKMVKIGV